jgi:hypothetical protein
MNRRLLLGGLLGAVLLLPGCAGAGTPSGQPANSPSSGGTVVSLVRTGGFAGMNDEVSVAADGSWSATDRTGGRRTGRLTEQQRAELDRLTADPALRGESDLEPSPSTCADAYSYRLTVGSVRVGFVDCPTGPAPPPTAAAIVRLLSKAVWGG